MHKNKTVLCEIANIYKPTKQIKKGKIMKKFLTLLALIIATVTAYATDYTGTATSTQGTFTPGSHTDRHVTVTETGSGVYTFFIDDVYASATAVADFTMENVTGTLNDDGSVSYSFEGDATTTDIHASYIADSSTKAVTMSGTFKDGILTITLSYKTKYSVACTYTFISEKTATETTEIPVTYTANAVEKYSLQQHELTNQVVNITKTGDNTYKVVYKDLCLGTLEIGDFTAEGVKGEEDADGNFNYTFSGDATVSNPGNMASAYGIKDGGTIPFTMVGSSKDNVLKAKFTTTIKSNEVVIIYNGYIETLSPTIVAGEEPAATTTVKEDYDTSSKFTETASIDWSKQKIVASIDMSDKTNYAMPILVVSAESSTTTPSPSFRILYHTSSNTLSVYTAGTTSSIKYTNTSIVNSSSKQIRIEISKEKGIYVNGTNCNYDNSTEITDIENAFQEIWNLKTIQIGNTYSMTGTAKYNYIRILDKDDKLVEATAVTLAESTSGTEMATTLSGYNNTCMASLTLTRTLVANAWNTLCLPFDVPATGLSGLGDAVIKKYKSVTGTTMYLEDATEIETGQPYLIKPAANIKNPTFQYATISSTEPTTAGTGDYQFVGVYGTKTFSDTDAQTSYILVSGGSLVNPKANTTMKGMRAYFTYTGKSEVAPRLVIDGVETALTEVVGKEEVSDGRIYNLRGMYVGNDASRLAKGIYIMNGKKVVLK